MNRLLVSSDEEAMAERQSGFDLIIDTAPVQHEVNPYVSLLAVDGALVMVGYFGPLPECEMIRMDQINEAFERMEKSDVRYRFVIDMRTLEG